MLLCSDGINHLSLFRNIAMLQQMLFLNFAPKLRLFTYQPTSARHVAATPTTTEPFSLPAQQVPPDHIPHSCGKYVIKQTTNERTNQPKNQTVVLA
jgi:hypothetical protein